MEGDGTPVFSTKAEKKNSKWLPIDVSDPMPSIVTERIVSKVVLDCGESIGDPDDPIGISLRPSHYPGIRKGETILRERGL